jgi:predicted phage-related endonuclease
MTANLEVVLDLTEHPQGSLEARRARSTGLGGTDAPKLLGLGGTPYGVFTEKTRDPEAELAGEEPEYMTWGKILEPVVREQYTARTGIEVTPVHLMVRNPDLPFALASPDGFGPDRIWEGKTTAARLAERWEEDENGAVAVPMNYGIQGQHYLGVTGFDLVDFACLIGGQELRIATVERNQALIDDLMAIEETFWDHVRRGIAPPASGADKGTLKAQWRATDEKKVELTPALVARLQSRADLDAQIKKMEATRDELDAEVMEYLQDAEVGTWNSVPVVTWKASSRSTIDAKAFREAHPALAAEFTKTTVSRRFLPKELS